MEEALAWANQAFAHDGGGYLDRRGPWLGLLFLGVIALGHPLAQLLPRAASRPLGRGPRWRPLLAIAIAPALLTPLILWKLPTGFLPLLLGDYLAVHFALYGVLTGIALALIGRRSPDAAAAGVSGAAIAIGALAVAAYSVLAIGLPIDRFITAFMPPPARLPLIGAMLAGMLPYFIADEWLTRGRGAPAGGYAATKLCFLLSLALAVALNPQRLFFLVIIVPVILAFFVIYGLFSAWAYRRTRHPLVGALANALSFAWATAVTFPVVG